MHFTGYIHVMRHSQWFLGHKGIFFRGTWKQRPLLPNFEGNRGTKTILENIEHRKQNFDFWVTGEQANLFQGNKGIGTLPPERAFIILGPWKLESVKFRKINIVIHF